jgi:hypothetical protein
MTDAHCRQSQTDLWYPEKGANCVTTARKAKQICDTCPVQKRCRDYALAYDEHWGIWGGINFGQTRAKDRDQLRTQHGITKLPTIERTDTFLVCLGDKRRNRILTEVEI